MTQIDPENKVQSGREEIIRQKVVLVTNCSQMVTDVDAGEDMQDKWLADVYGL